MPLKSYETCKHEEFAVEVSSHASEAGFMRPTYQSRVAATTPSGRVPARIASLSARQLEDEATELALTFPAPLVLPGECLALDPLYSSQSLRSWIRTNPKITAGEKRDTIYLAAPPNINGKLPFMKEWSDPIVQGKPRDAGQVPVSTQAPKAEDVAEYLRATNHGLAVKMLSHSFEFIPWEDKNTGRRKSGKATTTTSAPNFIGLRWERYVTRVRTRPCPDDVFQRQLNLSDILDAALEMLPSDAISVLMLVNHDLWEDDDDDFCCGRAFGGSHIAVVSSARYNPLLDTNGIDSIHMWPASHCRQYVDSLCDTETTSRSPSKAKSAKTATVKDGTRSSEQNTRQPIRAAIDAAALASAPDSATNLHGLWFSRITRTASHELGHCLGIDHCVYYACSMQGSAGVIEDYRQPPYLCPVCLKKLFRVVEGSSSEAKNEEVKYVTSRYEALMTFCGKWDHIPMFSGYRAWLQSVLGV